MPILSNSLVTRPLTPAGAGGDQLPHHDLHHRHAHAALLLPQAARQPRADRQPQLDHRRRRAEPAPHAGAGQRPAPQVPGAEGHRDRPLVVGLGRREPRHDAARVPARSEAERVLRARLRRQRRVVLGARRPAHGRAHRRRKDKAFELPIYNSPLPYPNVLELVESRPSRRSGASASASSTTGTGCATRSCDPRLRARTRTDAIAATSSTTSWSAPARPAACWPARLSEDPATRVLLLEAGPPDRSLWIHLPIGYGKTMWSPTYNWCFHTDPDPNMNGRRIYWPRGKTLGGSSSINGLIYIRGQREDYDHWAALGNAGLGLRRRAAVLHQVRSATSAARAPSTAATGR